MRLRDEQYEEIKAEVTDLFERYKVKCIPINGFELAIKMGIILISYSSLSPIKLAAASKVSSDGFYFEPGDGREYIYYNDNIGYARSNMTILHEIGHCVLGHDDGMDQKEAEAEAKFFAKYAAAPPPLVHMIKPTSPDDIGLAFGISYIASVYAFAYYHKWLLKHHRIRNYSTYEQHLLCLFDESA